MEARNMEKIEKVEKLRAKADITYEEAKTVLEECDWDLLEAVLKLESEGKTKNTAARFSTQGSSADDEPKSPQQIAESYQSYQKQNQKKDKGFGRTIYEGIRFILKKSIDNKFIVKRYGKVVLDIPVLLLVILMIGFFWILLILMGIGLFCGFNYSFAGPELGRDDINNAMNKASHAAETLKEEMKEQAHKEHASRNHADYGHTDSGHGDHENASQDHAEQEPSGQDHNNQQHASQKEQ